MIWWSVWAVLTERACFFRFSSKQSHCNDKSTFRSSKQPAKCDFAKLGPCKHFLALFLQCNGVQWVALSQKYWHSLTEPEIINSNHSSQRLGYISIICDEKLVLLSTAYPLIFIVLHLHYPLLKLHNRGSLAVYCRLKDYRGFVLRNRLLKGIIIIKTTISCWDMCCIHYTCRAQFWKVIVLKNLVFILIKHT